MDCWYISSAADKSFFTFHKKSAYRLRESASKSSCPTAAARLKHSSALSNQREAEVKTEKNGHFSHHTKLETTTTSKHISLFQLQLVDPSGEGTSGSGWG